MKYELWATRPAFSTAWSEGFGSFMVRKGLDRMVLISIPGGKVEYFVTQPSFDVALKKIQDEALEDSVGVIKNYYFIKKRLIRLAFFVGFFGRILPISFLKPLWKVYYKCWTDFQLYIMLPHSTERFLEKEIGQKFQEKFGLITSTPKPFEYMFLNRDIFEVSLSKMVRKYGWMSIYSWSEEPYKEDYFVEYKKKIDKVSVNNIFLEIKENNKKFDEFINSLKEEDKDKCRLLRELVYIRTDRVDVMRRTGFSTYPFLLRVVKKINKNFEMKEASMLSSSEIFESLTGEKEKEFVEILRKRGNRENVAIIFDKFGTKVVCDKNEFEFLGQELRNSLDKHDSDVREFKGVVAEKGKFMGPVRIYFRDKVDWPKDESGYVFVAKHTMPQDLPYMIKAGAIISDEGGITSHTAVVSRELKIPCIIGTKIATKVLKDGDIVEVDAERGIVKIIKRVNEKN